MSAVDLGRRRHAAAVAALACIGVAAAALLLFVTPQGLGLGGDSYYYVSGARGLLAGVGFARPAADGTFRTITHFPPLYSLVLASAGWIGLEIVSAARAMHVILFGLNAFLIGWLVWRGTASLGFAVAGAVLFAASPAMLAVHSWLLSEALFLCLGLCSVVWLVRALQTGRRTSLIAAGLAAGLAVLTRYAGFALVFSSGLVLIGWSGKRRWIDAGVTMGLGTLGGLGWALRNARLAGSLTNRELSLHLPGADKLLEGVTTAARWLLPGRLPIALGGTALLALAASLVFAAARRLARRGGADPHTPDAVLACSVAFVLIYPLVLIASLAFIDASTPLDDRILSPLFALGLVAALVALAPAVRRGDLLRGLVLVGLAGAVVLTLLRGGAKATELRQDGQGYASRSWRESSIVAWVAQLAPSTAVYSNELDALYLLTGRQAYQVPIWWDPVLAAPREDYAQQLAGMQARVGEGEAVLVLFNTLSTQQAFLPPEVDLADGFEVLLRAPDGVIYGAQR